MNTSNQNLLKGIKIFFKTIYILLIIFFIINLLSNGFLLFLADEDEMGSLAMYYVGSQPDITLNLQNKEHPTELFAGFGVAMVKGIPIGIRIINTLFIMISLFIYILIVRNIRLIIKSMEVNEVFTMSNARLLRQMGWLLLIDLLLSQTICFSNSVSLNLSDPTAIGGLVGLIIGMVAGHIMAIVFTFFMAAVFRIGVNIQEENQSFV